MGFEWRKILGHCSESEWTTHINNHNVESHEILFKAYLKVRSHHVLDYILRSLN